MVDITRIWFSCFVELFSQYMSVLKCWYRWPLSGNVSTVWMDRCVFQECVGVTSYFWWTRFCAKTLTDWHAGKYCSLIVYLMCFSICALFLCRFKHRIGIRMLSGRKWCSIMLLCTISKHLPGWNFNKVHVKPALVSGEQCDVLNSKRSRWQDWESRWAGEMWTRLQWNTEDVLSFPPKLLLTLHRHVKLWNKPI